MSNATIRTIDGIAVRCSKGRNSVPYVSAAECSIAHSIGRRATVASTPLASKEVAVAVKSNLIGK